MSRQLIWMAWPAFLVACFLEMVVFALVDPADIQWMGAPVAMSRTGLYTLGFLFFWLTNFACSALTLWLVRWPPGDLEQ